MEKVAKLVEKFYPKSDNVKQLKGASAKVFEWANDIQQEIKERK